MAKIIKAIIWTAIVATIILIAGCAVSVHQPELHPTLGTHLMIIPEGTKIGKQVAPEEGIFMSKSLTMSLMKEMERKAEREKQRKRIKKISRKKL